MASIAGITCTFLHTDDGRPPASLRQEVEVFRIAGLSGYGAMATGLGDGDFQLRAVLYTSAAGAAVFEAAVQALQSTIVAIVDDLGKSHTYCLLEKVGNAKISAAYVPGSAVTKRIEIAVSGKKVG